VTTERTNQSVKDTTMKANRTQNLIATALACEVASIKVQ